MTKKFVSSLHFDVLGFNFYLLSSLLGFFTCAVKQTVDFCQKILNFVGGRGAWSWLLTWSAAVVNVKMFAGLGPGSLGGACIFM